MEKLEDRIARVLKDPIYLEEYDPVWEVLFEVLTEVRVQKIGEVSAEYLLFCVTQGIAPGLIDLKKISLLIKRLVSERGIFKQRPESFFALM